MQLTVQGKQMDLGDALRAHIEEKITDINQKYFNRATFITVTLSPEGHGHGQVRTHIHLRIGKNIEVMSDALQGDPYASFDAAAEKVAKQMRKYKNRLRDHHERVDAVDFPASGYSVLAADENAEEAREEPLIVAEMATVIETMSVSDAVMRLDLSRQPALMFRNSKNDELNMIYRRADGNIGWVDPSGVIAQKKPESAEKRARA